jgi:hypothetical protein
MAYFEIAKRQESNERVHKTVATVGVCLSGQTGIPAKGDKFTGDTVGISSRKALRVAVSDSDIPGVSMVQTSYMAFNPR